MAESSFAMKTPRRAFSLIGTLARWFDGLTVNGIGFLVLLCLLNAVRRTARNLDDYPHMPISDWTSTTLRLAGLGLLIAVPVALTVVATYNAVRRPLMLRHGALIAGVAASCLFGVALQLWVEGYLECGGWSEACFQQSLHSYMINNFVRYGALCALYTIVFVYLRSADDSARRAQEAEHGRARFAQRMEEARFRMLQAQIEPHFLFNTLANVRRLYQTSPQDARRMLDNLMRYFAVALPQMRGNESTLGREAELTASYLEIQGIRMGRRLQFEREIPDHLADVPLPPMMVLTLAENAIKHGLAPLPQGGTVRITAAVEGHELLVRVADTGRGFIQTSGGGTGLANIRARLNAMYGAAGRLTLGLNTPRGVVATIAVPLARRREEAGA